MDPELWEMLEEGDSEDEVAAIIRLGQPGIVPPGVRVIVQFGEIVTVRMKRGSILDIREVGGLGFGLCTSRLSQPRWEHTSTRALGSARTP